MKLGRIWGMIINSDVKVFPARMIRVRPAPVGTNFDAREAAQLFNIEVQQIAGDRMLVAQTTETLLAQQHK